MALARNSLRVSLLFLSTAHLGLALSLRVSQGSPCEAVCPIAADHTSVELRSQICSDADFYNGQTGTKARGCLDCLKDSNYVLNYVNGSESDLSDLLCECQIEAELHFLRLPPIQRLLLRTVLIHQDNLRFILNDCLISNIGTLPDPVKKEFVNGTGTCDHFRYDLGFDAADLQSTDKYEHCSASEDVSKLDHDICIDSLRQYGYGYLTNCMELT